MSEIKFKRAVLTLWLVVLSTGCAKSGFESGGDSAASAPRMLASVPVGRASSAANIRVCPGASTVLGTDVSNYDPNTNWTTFAKAGRGFAFVKATEGITITNNLFASDWAALKKQGVLRGAYHFFHPGDDPTKQATAYLKVVGTLGPNDLGPMLDWEVSDGVSAANQIAKAKTWLALVEGATGKTPIVYVDPSFFNSLGNPQGFQKYPLFIANYGATCPDIPPPWSTFTFWQKSIGAVPGVESSQADVDLYNGPLSLLTAFTKN